MFIRIFIVVLAVFSLLLQSCNQSQGCGVDTSNMSQVKVSFVVRNKIKHTEKDTIIARIMVYGIGAHDTAINTDLSQTPSGKVVLNLSLRSDSCRYAFKIINTDSTYLDTLLFTYSRTLQMISDNCFAYKISLIHVEPTFNKLDTLVVVTNDVNATVNNNVKFYVKENIVQDSTKQTSISVLP
jgi:hypothetical protein